jgi:hypothetical protein
MVCYPWFGTIDYLEDELNWNRYRNVKNTKKINYNCGGYALGTFSWYLPIFDYDDDDTTYDFDDWDEAEEKTWRCVQVMKIEFRRRGLRVIESVAELVENEYAIAFRLSSDGDFHFLRRYSNGSWYHKRGNAPYIERISATEVFSDMWVNRYDGPIVLLAVGK